ncbi:hypothetical protein B0A48_09359 [Cryoendolithus antarcticus]|uniref:DNA replication regulator SLD2 n=1 Tax=Cryoendolithus antarcticus TaxID=1507870 RepID=A0A1V8SZ48_9PEZI|nr:hypothetical protein B0A48_09359 [Cryoendolithus antarcticus]
MSVQAANALRDELKTWEKNFRADHGRKPGRDDIKNDESIAAKYKIFNGLNGRSKPVHIQPEAPVGATPPRRATRRSIPNVQPLGEWPTNSSRGTPQKAVPAHKTLAAIALSPVNEDQATPAHIKCLLGPTPQRDGQVLGIFDMLESGTPSKGTADAAAFNGTLVAATPSKSVKSIASLDALSRTPQSSGTRRFLDRFAGTPLKRKRDTLDVGTPGTSKRAFSTPAFLRRSFPLAQIEEDHEELPAMLPPLPPRRSLARSLSSIIRDMKKSEDKRMEDEWDVLDELEAAARGEERRPARPEVMSDDEFDPAAHGALGPNGLPRKVWKKKGLKRTTKAHKFKPVLRKPRKAAELEDVLEEEVVSETRQTGAVPGVVDGDADYTDNDELPDIATMSAKPPQAKASTAAVADAAPPDGPVSKVAKKVSASANANFHKLKIKNKNSKANGRGGGKRFGKR